MHASLELQLVDLILDIQRQNRFIEQAYGTDLSLLESHILLDLVTEGQQTPGVLATRLGVPRSQMSQRITSLLERGYLQKRASRHDGRSYHLSLSSPAKTFLIEYHQRAEQLLSSRLSNVSSTERENYTHILGRFADAYGAAAVQDVSVVSPLRKEVLRLTRQLGLLGTRVFGIRQLHALRLQVLYHLESYGELHTSLLLEFLSCKPSTLSVLLSRLERQGLLSRVKHKTDKRQQILKLTQEGLTELTTVRERASEQLSSVLAGWSASDKERLLEVVRRLSISTGIQDKHPYLFLYSIRDFANSGERQEARRFLLDAWYPARLDLPLPGRLLSESSYCQGLFDRGRLIAFVEYACFKSTATLVHAAHRGIRHELMHAFMDSVRIILERQFPIESLYLSESVFAACVPEHWQCAPEDRSDRRLVSLSHSEIPGWDRSRAISEDTS